MIIYDYSASYIMVDVALCDWLMAIVFMIIANGIIENQDHITLAYFIVVTISIGYLKVHLSFNVTKWPNVLFDEHTHIYSTVLCKILLNLMNKLVSKKVSYYTYIHYTIISCKLM